MTKQHQIYKCKVCGNIVEVIHEGMGTLVCCNQPMELQIEKISEEGTEKHVPVVSFEDGKIIVNVGQISHPMEESHYIEWIEIIADNENKKVFLKPTDLPKAEFILKKQENFKVRSYCNIHGLWEGNF